MKYIKKMVERFTTQLRSRRNGFAQKGLLLRSQTKRVIAQKEKAAQTSYFKSQAKEYDTFFNESQFGSMQDIKTEVDKIPQELKPYMNYSYQTAIDKQNTTISEVQKSYDNSKRREIKYDDKDDKVKEKQYRAEAEGYLEGLNRLKKGEILTYQSIDSYADDKGDYARDVARAKEKQQTSYIKEIQKVTSVKLPEKGRVIRTSFSTPQGRVTGFIDSRGDFSPNLASSKTYESFKKTSKIKTNIYSNVKEIGTFQTEIKKEQTKLQTELKSLAEKERARFDKNLGVLKKVYSKPEQDRLFLRTYQTSTAYNNLMKKIKDIDKRKDITEIEKEIKKRKLTGYDIGFIGSKIELNKQQQKISDQLKAMKNYNVTENQKINLLKLNLSDSILKKVVQKESMTPTELKEFRGVDPKSIFEGKSLTFNFLTADQKRSLGGEKIVNSYYGSFIVDKTGKITKPFTEPNIINLNPLQFVIAPTVSMFQLGKGTTRFIQMSTTQKVLITQQTLSNLKEAGLSGIIMGMFNSAVTNPFGFTGETMAMTKLPQQVVKYSKKGVNKIKIFEEDKIDKLNVQINKLENIKSKNRGDILELKFLKEQKRIYTDDLGSYTSPMDKIRIDIIKLQTQYSKTTSRVKLNQIKNKIKNKVIEANKLQKKRYVKIVDNRKAIKSLFDKIKTDQRKEIKLSIKKTLPTDKDKLIQMLELARKESGEAFSKLKKKIKKDLGLNVKVFEKRTTEKVLDLKTGEFKQQTKVQIKVLEPKELKIKDKKKDKTKKKIEIIEESIKILEIDGKPFTEKVGIKRTKQMFKSKKGHANPLGVVKNVTHNWFNKSNRGTTNKRNNVNQQTNNYKKPVERLDHDLKTLNKQKENYLKKEKQTKSRNDKVVEDFLKRLKEKREQNKKTNTQLKEEIKTSNKKLKESEIELISLIKINNKFKSKFGFMPISLIKIKQLTNNISRLKQSVLNLQKLESKIKQQFKQLIKFKHFPKRPKQKKEDKIKPSPRIKRIPKPPIKPIIKPVPTPPPKPKPVPKIKPKPTTKPKPIIKPTFRLSPVPKTKRKIINTNLGELSFVLSSPRTKQKQVINVKTNLPYNEALRLGREITDNTILASFSIKHYGKTKKRKSIVKTDLSKFRKSKMKDPKVRKLVELQKYRLDRRLEKISIVKARLKALINNKVREVKKQLK